MAKKQLRIGLIGYGFMGRAHSNAFAQVGHFFPSSYEIVLKAVCARDAAKAQEFADRWGYQSIETDWKKLIARDDIDVVDIAVPNNLHAEIAIAAAKAGKMILCEKPLALNSKQAETMVKAIEKAKVPNMVWYNYRRCPAVVLAKQLIDAGKLGKVFSIAASAQQNNVAACKARQITRPAQFCEGAILGKARPKRDRRCFLAGCHNVADGCEQTLMQRVGKIIGDQNGARASKQTVVNHQRADHGGFGFDVD